MILVDPANIIGPLLTETEPRPLWVQNQTFFFFFFLSAELGLPTEIEP